MGTMPMALIRCSIHSRFLVFSRSQIDFVNQANLRSELTFLLGPSGIKVELDVGNFPLHAVVCVLVCLRRSRLPFYSQ